MHLHSSLFMERLIRFLMPYFVAVTPDPAMAREEIFATLASYGARSRAEMLSAVQVIAFGLAALETLEEAASSDLSPAMRLRFRGCANNLNRSCERNENALAQRLRCDPSETAAHAEPTGAVPHPAATRAEPTGAVSHPAAARAEPTGAVPHPAAARVEPLDALPDAESEEIIRRAQAAIETHHNRLTDPSPAHLSPTVQASANPGWGTDMLNDLARMGMPVRRASPPD